MRYKWIAVVIIILFCVAYITSDKDVFNVSNETEANDGQLGKQVIHYKMLDEYGEPGLYSFTNTQEQKLFLNITPETTKERPILYSVFLNGRQVECLWNGEAASNYRTTIKPGEKQVLEISILNVPQGKNMYQLGTVHFPDKNDWGNYDVLLNSAYSMDLTSFTIIRQTGIVSQELLTFPYEQDIFESESEIADLALIEGDLSLAQDQISGGCIYNSDDVQKLYYHWRNSNDEPVMVRFSLMKDWEQIPWTDTGELFLDTKANSGDYLVKEIDLSKTLKSGTNQYMVLAFINPGVSFWYYDKDDNRDHWKVNPIGAQGWATLRNIVIK